MGALPQEFAPPIVVASNVINVAIGCISADHARVHGTAIPDTLYTVTLLVQYTGLDRIRKKPSRWVATRQRCGACRSLIDRMPAKASRVGQDQRRDGIGCPTELRAHDLVHSGRSAMLAHGAPDITLQHLDPTTRKSSEPSRICNNIIAT